MGTEKQYLIVKDIIKSDFAITSDDGNKVYEQIFQNLSRGNSVVLNFEGITVMITAFLNAAIGKLYEHFDSETLNEHLKLENVAPNDRILFKMVVQRAKEYFANREIFEETVANTL